MGRKASAVASGWRSLWRFGLLAASILSSCFLLTEGQGTTIQVLRQPLHPVEGNTVTLTPTPADIVQKALICRWFRGLATTENERIFSYYTSTNSGQTNGPAFTGRETAGPGCSLHIRNLTSDDTRNYTVTLEGPEINVITGSVSVVVAVVLLKPTVSAFPSTYLKEFTDSVQLTCKTNSEYANVSWLWNGEPLRNSSRIQLNDGNWILDIKNITRSDAGMYQCQVSNSVSNDTSDITYIDVIYGPDAPVIQPDNQTYNYHSNITLNCTASSGPEARYFWFFNEKNVANGSVLLFQNVTREHSGNYTCQAENIFAHRTSSTTLNITVVGGVYDVTITGPSTAIENLPVTLNCTCVGTNVSYSWFKGDQLMEPGDNVLLENNNQTLTLNPSTRNDSANYTCYASNNCASNSSEPHWLEIFYGPDAPIIKPQETVYSVGSNLNLSCFANSNPPANYSWYHNGWWLEQELKSQLLILDLNETDAGDYTCNATNDATGLFSDANLEITFLKPVTKIIVSGPDKVFENNITVLNCNSEGTSVSYYWLEGNQSPEMKKHIFLSNDNKTLTFNQTMRSDSGNYTCYGYNNFSEASATYRLDVLYGPDVPIISPTKPEYAEGSNFSLSCDADSNPPAQFTWLINGSVEAGNEPQLLRVNLSLSDSGNYTCSAFNNETNNSNSSVLEIYVLRENFSYPTFRCQCSCTNVACDTSCCGGGQQSQRPPQENLSSPVLWTTAEGMVAENTNVTLNCNTSDNQFVSVSWFKDGETLLAVAGLADRNRTLSLTRVTKNDTGLYRCEARNPVSSAMSNSTNITVAYGPEVKLNPEGTVEQSINSYLKLECTAVSVPAARFQWYFNNIAQNATENIFQVRLSNWTDEGNYTCQATNPFTLRSAMKTAYVKLTKAVGGNTGNGLSGGAIAGIVIGCLAGVALIAGLLYFICTKTSFGRTELHTSNGNVPSAPGHNQGVTDTKPKAGEEDLQYSILAFKETNRSPPRPTSEAPQPLDSGIIYSEIKKK